MNPKFIRHEFITYKSYKFIKKKVGKPRENTALAFHTFSLCNSRVIMGKVVSQLHH